MKIFRTLQLHGDAAAIAEARRRLTAFAATPTWERDDQIVQQVSGMDATAFRYRGSRAPGAFVWLTWETNEARVSNIVPAKPGSLTYDEYNNIAGWFTDEVLHPSLNTIASLRIALGPGEKELEDLVTKATADALRRFSIGANKSTGTAHPSDADRWNVFLIRAHLESARFSPDLLQRWLSEEEGWEDEWATELAIEYERGRELLRRYDEETRVT